MNLRSLLKSSKSIKNSFSGQDANEVWAKLKAKANPVDRARLLAAMAEAKKNK